MFGFERLRPYCDVNPHSECGGFHFGLEGYQWQIEMFVGGLLLWCKRVGCEVVEAAEHGRFVEGWRRDPRLGCSLTET